MDDHLSAWAERKVHLVLFNRNLVPIEIDLYACTALPH